MLLMAGAPTRATGAIDTVVGCGLPLVSHIPLPEHLLVGASRDEFRIPPTVWRASFGCVPDREILTTTISFRLQLTYSWCSLARVFDAVKSVVDRKFLASSNSSLACATSSDRVSPSRPSR